MSKLPGKAFTMHKYMPVARISAADGAILPFTGCDAALLQPEPLVCKTAPHFNAPIRDLKPC
jgi:hypothetical protein